MNIILFMIFTLTAVCKCKDLPTLYDYYRNGGIKYGLEAPASGFKLNGKDITIFSGAIHYFRIHPKYWRNSLQKLRSAGLNTVETYIPWNLHEPEKGVFDFGDGNRDFSMFLNVSRFVQIALEEDLLVIIRPGPYICSEWEFGGLPSWLLRVPDIKVRTSDPKFTERVKIYFDELLPHLVDHQFLKGGSIIAVQIENEYGDFGDKNAPRDKEYLQFLKKTFEENGFKGLFATCDTPGSVRDIGSLPDVLQTATFSKNPDYQLSVLKELQPDRALMVMEYWSGWYDHWLDESHQTGLTDEEFENNLEKILKQNASLNIYMFHGGTDFGFMNGADPLASAPFTSFDASSYDYAAPLTEAGDYTVKYGILEKIVAKYNKVMTKLPQKPTETKKFAYPPVKITHYLTFGDIIQNIDKGFIVIDDSVLSMEALNINDGNGQSYGYINYHKTITLTRNSTLQIVGHVRDTVMLLLDGVQRTKLIKSPSELEEFGYWVKSDSTFTFNEEDEGEHTLDLLVENWGRVNYGNPEDFIQCKGLWEGPIIIDGIEQKQWKMTAIQFNSEWIKGLQGWRTMEEQIKDGPALLKGTFRIDDEPADTWLDLSTWGKGVAFINGFNVGRYLYLGPPTSLYIPAPFLHSGINEVVIFEHHTPNTEIRFTDKPVYNNHE